MATPVHLILKEQRCGLCEKRLPRQLDRLVRCPCLEGHFFCRTCLEEYVRAFHMIQMTETSPPTKNVRCPTCLTVPLGSWLLHQQLSQEVCGICQQHFPQPLDLRHIYEFDCLFQHHCCASCVMDSLPLQDCPACATLSTSLNIPVPLK